MKVFFNIFILLFLFGCSVVESDSRYWNSFPIGIQDNIDKIDLQLVIDSYNDYYNFELFYIDPDGVEVLLVPDSSYLSTPNAAADAQTFYDKSSGHITKGVIRFSQKIVEKSNSQALNCIMAHEMAHILGFSEHMNEGVLRNPAPVVENIQELFVDDFTSILLNKYPEIDYD